MKVKKLTNRNADSLKPPKGLTESGKPKLTAYYRDAELRGFALRVSAAGGRTWVVEYSLHGRQFSHVIGKRELFTADAARNEARKLLGDVARDSNPLSEKQKGKDADAERRAAATFGELYDQWLEEGGKYGAGGKTKKSASNDASARKKFADLENKKAREITTGQIESILDGVKKATPIAANRALALIKTVCRFGVDKKVLETDPTQTIKKPSAENEREARLTRAELDVLFNALEAHPDRLGANAIKLLVWTGARMREVLWARWSQYDLEHGYLYKGVTKSGKRHSIALDPFALDLLREMKREATSEFVFPSRPKPTGPRWDLDSVWHPVRKVLAQEVERKEIEDMTVHDLRHVYATALLEGGASKEAIAPLLGHATTSLVRRYAHTSPDYLATERAKASSLLAPPAPKLLAPPTTRASKRGRKAVAR